MFKLTLEEIEKNLPELEKYWEEVLPDLFEMGAIKTEIDSLLLSVGSEGNKPTDFLASKYHFLMRQLRFAIQEATRHCREYEEKLLEIEELRLDIEELEEERDKLGTNFPTKIKRKVVEIKKKEIEIQRCEDHLRSLKLDAFNRINRVSVWEKIRKRILELHDNKPFTNEEYQREQTDYYNWFVRDRLVKKFIANQLNLPEGIINAHQSLARESLIPEMAKPIDNLLKIVGNEETGQYNFTLDWNKVFQDGALPGQVQLLEKGTKESFQKELSKVMGQLQNYLLQQPQPQSDKSEK